MPCLHTLNQDQPAQHRASPKRVKKVNYPSPSQFGLPLAFSTWRGGQVDAINWALDSPSRFMCLCMPTGSGKSLVGMAMASMSGTRAAYLTSTRGLQDQIAGDFGISDPGQDPGQDPEHQFSVDIRGMQNYVCDMAVEFGLPRTLRVADGPCLSGAKCPLQSSGCHYFDTYRRAQSSPIIVTNYQMWMHGASGLSGSENPVRLLICDEGHSILDELSLYLATTVERRDCLSLGVTWPVSGYTQAQWQEWGQYWAEELGSRMDILKQEIKDSAEASSGASGSVHVKLHEMKLLRQLKRDLDRVAAMVGEWVIEEQDRRGDTMLRVQFDPLWPGQYAEANLFRGIEKVILMSATLREASAEVLGVPRAKMEFREFPSTFPKQNRPVIHVPTVRMNHKNEANDDSMMWFLRKVDLLIDNRQDRKGLVHTVSYKRAKFIYDNSRHRDRMLIHGSDNRAWVLDQFKRSGPGTILLSPSMDTGYDFAGELAEYQIIVKLPFPDTRGAVIKARCGADKRYGDYLVAQVLQQMAGRVCRSDQDRGETLVLDDNFVWFYPRAREYFNGWFRESVIMMKQGRLPVPLPKLEICPCP